MGEIITFKCKKIHIKQPFRVINSIFDIPIEPVFGSCLGMILRTREGFDMVSSSSRKFAACSAVDGIQQKNHFLSCLFGSATSVGKYIKNFSIKKPWLTSDRSASTLTMAFAESIWSSLDG